MIEARYYKKIDKDKVQCLLCPHYCLIENGKRGICRSRENKDGVLISLNYERAAAVNHYDPVEKKPLYHFLPGQKLLSLGAPLCNLHCSYCQNHDLSQNEVITRQINSLEIYNYVQKYDLQAVAFTYSEPVIWYEFVYDTCKYLRERGIKTIMVTNGYINQEPLKALLPHLSAMNIDLKSIRDDFYLRNCGGHIAPVLETIKTAAKHIHLELTNLIITDENDSEEDIIELIDFVAGLDKRIPLHFSRYFPCYKLKNPATSQEILHFAFQQAKKKLDHVYLGNMPFINELICENCGHILGVRGYGIPLEIENGRCPECGHINYGIW